MEPDIVSIAIFFGIILFAVLLLCVIDKFVAKYMRGECHPGATDISETEEGQSLAPIQDVADKSL